MSKTGWQLEKPVSAIVFDCDGTLTSLEGIDFLAKNNGVGDVVRQMTTDAMNNTGLNPTLYRDRLQWVLPRREQVYALGYQYFMHKAEDSTSVINLLQRLNKEIYLVSAGMNPAVKMFAELLQISLTNVFAVDLHFDQQGNYLHCDESSPLINNGGKRHIILELKKHHEQVVHVGDGINDIVSADIVSRFIGYGGVIYRKNIADLCQYYIHAKSLTAVLPLILTEEEIKQLEPQDQILYQQGLQLMQDGKVKLPEQEAVSVTPSLIGSLQFE